MNSNVEEGTVKIEEIYLPAVKVEFEDGVDFGDCKDVNMGEGSISLDRIDVQNSGTYSFSTADSKIKIENAADSEIKIENVVATEYMVEDRKADLSSSLGCYKCGANNRAYCPKCSSLSYILNHGDVSIKSKYNINGLPDNILEIRTNLKTGVFALQTIPKNVIFGPFEGIKGNNKRWKIINGKLANVENGNWMKFISYTSDESLNNLYVLQFRGSLYYQTIKKIDKGEELLVHFCNSDTVGKYYYPNAGVQGQIMFVCTLCSLGFTLKQCLIEHKQKCPYVKERKDEIFVIRCYYCRISLEKDEYLAHHAAYCIMNYPRVRKFPTVVDKKSRRKLRGCTAEIVKKSKTSNVSNAMEKLRGCTAKIVKNPKTSNVSDAIEKLRGCTTEIVKNPNTSNLSDAIEASSKRKLIYKCRRCFFRTPCKQNLVGHPCVPKSVIHYKFRLCEDSRLKQHIKNDNTKDEETNYKCRRCPYRTNNKQSLIMHTRDVHWSEIEKNFKCSLCPYKTDYKINYEVHMKSKHRGEIANYYECLQCPYRVDDQQFLKLHLEFIHRKRFTIENTKMQIQERMKEIILGNDYKCPQDSFETCYIHVMEVRRKKYPLEENNEEKEVVMKIYKCAHCFHQTASKESITAHVKNHVNKGTVQLYKCFQCPYQTIYKICLENHLIKCAQRLTAKKTRVVISLNKS